MWWTLKMLVRSLQLAQPEGSIVMNPTAIWCETLSIYDILSCIVVFPILIALTCQNHILCQLTLTLNTLIKYMYNNISALFILLLVAHILHKTQMSTLQIYL